MIRKCRFHMKDKKRMQRLQKEFGGLHDDTDKSDDGNEDSKEMVDDKL